MWRETRQAAQAITARFLARRQGELPPSFTELALQARPRESDGESFNTEGREHG